MNDYLNNLLNTVKEDYVIASDTDSIYLNLGPLVDKFFSSKSGDKAAVVGILDKICQEKIEPYIDKSYADLATYVSAYDQKMKMKRRPLPTKVYGLPRKDTFSMLMTSKESGLLTLNLR